MQEQILSSLEKNEELLWIGRPESFVTSDKTNGPVLKRNLIIKIIVTLFLCLGYVLLTMRPGSSFKLVPMLIILVLGAYICGMGYLNADTIREKVCYAVTDKRLICLNNTLQSMDYSLIKTAAFRTDADGHTSLLCGSEAVRTPAHQWRGFTTVSPRIDPATGNCDNMILYAMPEWEKVRDLLRQYIPVE